ncbi:phenylalanyl-tRNA synthetase beta chain [Nematocida displodere]|uniref:phenylalanine--tRNA ligase n=1 Tax=Nematocida displodere TaxID=1805483 RepID=A0A177EI12_9MICR|nr:phenylalanyl-tRNA synthetase beta chain [Nematocida displodere]
MPAITVSKTEFLQGIQKQMTDDEVDSVLFDFGLELDEILAEEETKYKIDIPANRYDLLCLKGLVNGVSAYLESKPQKEISIKENGEAVLGTPPAERPFIKMAILKNIDLSNGGYQDLIDFQDKLHQGLGQNRALMAIGTHNYDVTQRPYTYTAMEEEKVSFVPLNQTKEYTRPELDALYAHDPKLKDYTKHGRAEGTVPVLLDGAGRILSLPPLINSDFSKITPQTKNVLVEVTGTDLPRVDTAMYLILHHFSEAGTIIEEFLYAKAGERPPLTLTKQDIERDLLLSITEQTAAKYLTKMMHRVEVQKEGEAWEVCVHPTKLRPDVLHKCDLVEDVAIAHGYNNFEKLLSATYSCGEELPINAASSGIRRECAMVGYTEMFTMALLSKNDCTGFGISSHIQLKNSKSSECEVLRQVLAPSILKCIFSNQHHHLPIKVFEVSDVGVFDASDVGVRNDRRLCMAIAGAQSGLEDLQEAFDVVMKRIGVRVEYQEENTAPFLNGRACGVYANAKRVGSLGIVDPSVIRHHKIPHVCSLVEISLTTLLDKANE